MFLQSGEVERRDVHRSRSEETCRWFIWRLGLLLMVHPYVVGYYFLCLGSGSVGGAGWPLPGSSEVQTHSRMFLQHQVSAK